MSAITDLIMTNIESKVSVINDHKNKNNNNKGRVRKEKNKNA